MSTFLKSTPLSVKQWQMIKLLLNTSLNRSEMIVTLGISRATFYRWLSDSRIRSIIRKFEIVNFKQISADFQKRCRERVKQFRPSEKIRYRPEGFTPKDLPKEELRSPGIHPKKKWGRSIPIIEDLISG